MRATVVMLATCGVLAMACSARDRTSDADGMGGAAGVTGSGATGGSAGDAGTDGAFCEGFDDGNACTIDSCSPSGVVTHTPVALDDSNACTTDSCDQLTGTVAHEPVLLDDSDACTIDSCDPSTGVVHEEGSFWKCADTTPCPTGFQIKDTKFSCNCGDCGSANPPDNYLLCAPIGC